MIPIGKVYKRNLSVIRRKIVLRIGTPLPVEKFFELLANNIKGHKTTVFDVNVYLDSNRYKMFQEKGVTCAHCGREGKLFIMEKHLLNDVSPHFNLYAIDPNGKLVLMTKDHIIPKSKGGSSKLSNLQPLCSKCNNKKGNRMEGESYV